MTHCPICGRPASVAMNDAVLMHVECAVCGAFEIAPMTYEWWTHARAAQTLDEPLLPYLSCYTRQVQNAKITDENWSAFARQHAESSAQTRLRKLISYGAGKSKFIGDRFEITEQDYPLVDAGSPAELDGLVREALKLGLLDGEYPLYELSPGGREYLAGLPQPNRIFLSHAALDSALAAYLADLIRKSDGSREVFVASQPGNIRTGEKWLDEIESKLITGSVFVVLLTPTSIERPWLWFETGTFWFLLDRRIIPLCAGLEPADIPFPLAARQALSLSRPNEIEQFFDDLGIACPADPDRIVEAVDALVGSTALGDYIEIGGEYYIWSGRLGHLEDRPPVFAPKELQSAFDERGFKVRCGLPDKHHAGYSAVFQSDRRTWKRQVRCQEVPSQVLLVKAKTVAAGG